MAARVTSFRRAALPEDTLFDRVVLDADERHLRRKRITLEGGNDVLIDFAEPVKLQHGDRLVLEDGRVAEVVAADEDLMEVRGHDAQHLAQIAWHIGNRHLAAQIGDDRILIRQDVVIARMLEGLGAAVKPVRERFTPEHGAYHAHGH
ncbi:urease accessory protein UreE [Aestuariivirga sp.]|uniref:urease accessory protein UreE n=1 Tax=Aestuariivirga sp. TaxID=2650926 RepID=UPI0039E5210A